MGFAQVLSRAQVGLTAPLVRVEVHLGAGLPTFTLVGLPAPVVRESRERVRAALAHCGFELPAGRITVNLAPADLPKEGGRFDLPIALGVLAASGQLALPGDPARTEFYGELGLTGELKPVPGLLLAALQAGLDGHQLFLPRANAQALAGACPAALFGVAHLSDLAAGGVPVVDRPPAAGAADPGAGPGPGSPALPELADVQGQWQAKRALLIAAAGAHSLLMLGPPGSGKSMLAQRLPALLPPLAPDEALQVAAIASVAEAATGTREGAPPWCGSGEAQRPFRAPHHTASAVAIVGGGPRTRPGEVSLAHQGVLFLDELPEFDRRVLESLREPLESGRVSLVRAEQHIEYPARFQLVAAMNPCPCGRAGLARPACRCEPHQLRRYRARISGPLWDRLDLAVRLPPVDPAVLLAPRAAASAASGAAVPGSDVALTTAAARAQVIAARARQQSRQGGVNARLDAHGTLRHCTPDAAGAALLRQAAAQHGHSARSQHRVLRVARSIADLAASEAVLAPHVAEALALRLPPEE